MKKSLLDLLICPRCLPAEHRLQEAEVHAVQDDLLDGELRCRHCAARYPIRDGLAFLTPQTPNAAAPNRYETPALLASYLWSHYGDLLDDPLATDAYRQWAALMRPGPGLCLDLGAAVGRFSFEMAAKCDFVIGLDNSVSFIRACRELMLQRQTVLHLPEEGLLTRTEHLTFPGDWRTDNTEFIVADAQALPFPAGTFAALSSLNMVDKLPQPLAHLQEINRVAQASPAQFLFSDPFSWSPDVAPAAAWLGGTPDGRFAGRARDNIMALLEGKLGGLAPVWRVEEHGQIWWKIRTHANHYEMIRSCFIKASR